MENEQLFLKDTYELSEVQVTGIHCSAVIKTAIEKTTLHHTAFMKKMAENISSQEKQISEQNKKIKQVKN